MYTPASFEQSDLTTLQDFIEQHSFGVLITTPANVDRTTMNASHLPFLLDRSGSTNGRLIGHMARANCQWQEADNREALVIFSGPHAYISPSWYTAQNVVPTWNYVAVHASGILKVINERDRLLQIIRDTVDVYESSREPAWSLSGPEPEFIDKLLDAIVGFEIEIDELQGKWKLSQNHDADRRSGVIEGLRRNNNPLDAAVAGLMADL